MRRFRLRMSPVVTDSTCPHNPFKGEIPTLRCVNISKAKRIPSYRAVGLHTQLNRRLV